MRVLLFCAQTIRLIRKATLIFAQETNEKCKMQQFIHQHLPPVHTMHIVLAITLPALRQEAV